MSEMPMEMGEMNGCPRCGGWVREMLGPGVYRCMTRLAGDDGVCGKEYAPDSARVRGVCECGVPTLATCYACDRPVCATHGKIRQLRRYCAQHAEEPVERRIASVAGPARRGDVIDVDGAVLRAVARAREEEDRAIVEQRRREHWVSPQRIRMIEGAIATFLRLAAAAGHPGAQPLEGVGALRKGWEIGRHRPVDSPGGKSYLIFLRTNGDLHYGDTQWGVIGPYTLGGEVVANEVERDRFISTEDTIPVVLADLCLRFGLTR